MTFYEHLIAEANEDPRNLVRTERSGDRAVVTLDEPARQNALSPALTRQIRTALEDLAADSQIRSIVVTGADPGFSAGGDLEMMGQAPEALAGDAGATDIWRWIRYEFGAIARLIARSDTAFIAANSMDQPPGSVLPGP